MIEIGGIPLLIHIMKIYSHYGFNDFIVCLGYMGYYIKEYFSNFTLHRANVVYDFSKGTVDYFDSHAEPWRVSLVDTGLDTMTGGRLKRVRSYVGDETFMLTYGDGVADVDITELARYHQWHGKAATVTAVQPPGRFGALDVADSGTVAAFREKPQDPAGWINGGFFVLEPSVFDHLNDDSTVWEREPLEALAARGELIAYRHRGFWQPVDTLREKRLLEDLWLQNRAPWKVW
jgi:glucose-1-phosphate cytidylyltransferase